MGKLIGDLRQLHPRVKFVLKDFPGDEVSQVHFGGVVVLVIAELIDNSVAAVGEIGSVEVEVATLSAAGILQITVKDSGPGVQPSLENRIFEEEVSTKGAGRGLGLHLVQESVRLLRGSIAYTREGGSMFCVRLPLSK